MSDNSHVSQDVKTCLTVFPVLAALILITVFVHQSHLSYNYQLAIELVKACIVVGYFIHLIANRKEINNVWWITISVVVGLLFLPLINSRNHIVGTVDTSKILQAEKLTEKTSVSEEHEEEHVH
jgi:cytochrome c oxidase subunit IV